MSREMKIMNRQALIAAVGGMANICAEAYAADINPLPMLRETTGARVDFGYYQEHEGRYHPPAWWNDGEFLIGVSLFSVFCEETDDFVTEEVTVTIIEGAGNTVIAEASARPHADASVNIPEIALLGKKS